MTTFDIAPLHGQQRILTWIFIPLFGIFMPSLFGCMITMFVISGTAFATDASTLSKISYLFMMVGIVLMMPIWFTILFFYRPLAVELTGKQILVKRPLSTYQIPCNTIQQINYPAKIEYRNQGWWGQWQHSGGVFGLFGKVRQRDGSIHHMFVTDDSKVVEIILMDGKQYFISPNKPEAFVKVLAQYAG